MRVESGGRLLNQILRKGEGWRLVKEIREFCKGTQGRTSFLLEGEVRSSGPVA